MTPELEARIFRNVSPRVLAARWEKVYAAAARCRWDRHARLPQRIGPATVSMLARMVRAADHSDPEPWGFRAWEDGQLVGNLLQFRLEDASRAATVDDRRGAIKVAIDVLNSRRNRRIDDIDGWFNAYVRRRAALHGPPKWRSIESPGSMIDRLSVLFIKTQRFKGEKRMRAVKMWRGLLTDWGAYLKALRHGEATFRYYGGDLKGYGRK